MISDIVTALSEFFKDTFDKILDKLNFNWFFEFLDYAKSFVSQLKTSIVILMDVVNGVPLMFRSFLIISITVSVGYLVIGRGRVN